MFCADIFQFLWVSFQVWNQSLVVVFLRQRFLQDKKQKKATLSAVWWVSFALCKASRGRGLWPRFGLQGGAAGLLGFPSLCSGPALRQSHPPVTAAGPTCAAFPGVVPGWLFVEFGSLESAASPHTLSF